MSFGLWEQDTGIGCRDRATAGPSPSLGHFMGQEAPDSWAPPACVRGVCGAACRPPVPQWLPWGLGQEP